VSGFTVDIDGLSRALANEKTRRVRAAGDAARSLAVRMEASAKSGRTWQDRTGRARDAIRGTVEESGGVICIVLTGGAPYSAELELGHGGRYAVLGPTVRAFVPEFLKMMSKDKP
jgi:hypothetical protein